MKKIVKIIFRSLLHFLFLFIYLLSFFVIRDKKIWVFGGRKSKNFADNSKYFFLYTSNHHNDKIKSIWISKNKNIVKMLRKNNYKSYYAYSLIGIYYILKAKYFIFSDTLCDINFWLSGGAKKINLWHGIPLKKIEYDNKFDPRNFHGLKKVINWFVAPWIFIKNNYVISTSEFVTNNCFLSAFRTRCMISGYPRNDVFF